MKKFKLMLVAFMAMIGVNAMADNNAPGKTFTDVLGIKYEIVTKYVEKTTTTPAVLGTVKVLKYTNTLLTTDLEIPETTSNVETDADINPDYLYKVVAIDAYTATNTQFKGAKAGKITIPATVTSIGKGAFENIEATEVVIKAGSGLTSIGDDAFKGATKLAKFGSANAIGLVTIGANAFQGTALTEFTFGVDLTSIGAEAFKGTKIVTLDFSACTKFSHATADMILRWFTDDTANSGFNTNATLTTVKLPASLATASNKVNIAASAFKGCTALATIGATAGTAKIPAFVASIGNDAFVNTAITKFDMSENSITTIGTWFSTKPTTGDDLSKLQQIILNSNATTPVAYSSFAGLTKISTLAKVGITGAEYALPAKTAAAAIADGVFEGTALTQLDLSKVEAAVVTFPTIVKGVTTLTSIVLNNQTTALKAEAFYGCTSLNSLTVKDKDGAAKDLKAIETVNTGAFYRTALTTFEFGNALATFNTPWAPNATDAADAVKKLLPYTLAESISVDMSACTNFNAGIPANTFQKVAALTSIKLPAGLTVINANAFEGTGLTTVDLPATITQNTTAGSRGIKTAAFKDCASLTKITFYPETETASIFATDDVFSGCSMVGIYVTATYAAIGGPVTATVAPTYSKWVTSGAVTVETVKDKVHPYAMKGFIADGNYCFDAEKCQVYEAYIDGTEVVMSPLQKRDGKYNVPAGHAVIVRTAEATTINPLTYTASATNSSMIFGRMSVTTTNPYGENVLRSTYIDLTAGTFKLEEELTRAQAYKNYMYVLVNNATAGFGFQHFTGSKIKKGNIYVINPTNIPAGARLNMVWLDENGNVEYDATAIQSVKAAEAENGAVYNLAGQKVSAAYKGVVIKNGKKYIMK